MAKKLCASSRSGKQIRVSAESIWSKSLNKRQNAALDGVASRQKSGDACQIDYSDIPALTDKQLSESSARPRNWWPCVLTLTYSSGFSNMGPAIQRASITFFGWS
jgi:2-phospho-L-lactate guanylyltransferase (CobY/MobA/RfbA family)